MQVSLEGWGHRDRNHILLGADISGLKPSTEKVHLRDNTYIAVDEEGLCITAGTERIELTGSFCLEIRFTSNDLANLARIALCNRPLGEVVDVMSKTGRAVSVVDKRSV